jgi:hypothetical protein
MAFTLIQAGGNLYSVNTSGDLSSALSLPTGTVLATNRVPRFARFKQYVVVVNTPTRPLSVDTEGVVRPLVPAAPSAAPTLSSPTAGSLSGAYTVKQTYVIYDSLGNIIAESPYSAASSSLTIASKKLKATFLVSPEGTVTRSKFYRTATAGSTYFPWITSVGNVDTTVESDLSDAGLGTVAGPSLGAPPDLTLICEWNGRLWGVDRTNVDDLRYTESGTMYAWYALNTIPISPVGADAAGVTALLPRRNSLGVGRKNAFSVINGTSLSNFTQTRAGQEIGVDSQESVVVYKDTAFFLWRDGVYTWDNNGFTSITDGKVRSWFTSDTYFNRAMFWRAFASLDAATQSYRLYLASAGSSQIDRWIEYDLTTGSWFGPHKTDVFHPSCAITAFGANQQPYHMVGSAEGFVSLDQEARNDWAIGGIALSAKTKQLSGGQPDYEKYFGELSVLGKAQSSGTLSVTPYVGDVDTTTAGTPFSYDMTQSRQRLGRIGRGQTAALKFDHSTKDEDVMLYGYEINPLRIVGRR